MIRDFLGGIDEEILRTNFIMIYDIIEEMIVRRDVTAGLRNSAAGQP